MDWMWRERERSGERVWGLRPGPPDGGSATFLAGEGTVGRDSGTLVSLIWAIEQEGDLGEGSGWVLAVRVAWGTVGTRPGSGELS